MEPGETGKVGLEGQGAALLSRIPIWASKQASLAGKCSPACLVFLGRLPWPGDIYSSYSYLAPLSDPSSGQPYLCLWPPCRWSRDAGLAKHSDAKVLLVYFPGFWHLEGGGLAYKA